MRHFPSRVSTLLGVLIVAACSGKAFESVQSGLNDSGTSGQSGATNNAGGAAGGRGGANSGAAGSSTGNGGSIGTGTGGSGGGPIGTGTGSTVGAGTGGVIGSAGGSVGGGTEGGVITPGSGGTVGGGTEGGVITPGSGGAPPLGCDLPADCPAPTTVCQAAVCVGHQCGFVAQPNAIPPINRPGDCMKVVCSANGAETRIDDPADSNDGNECTTDSCQGGTVIHTVAAGARCQNGTKICAANGTCVGCVSDSDCSAGTGECSKESCVQGVCKRPLPGTLCNGFLDQCDDLGNCVDCWNSGGCDECCVCSQKTCIPA